MALKENTLVAMVRVRGTVGVRKDISETLERLRLPKPHYLSLAYTTKPIIGMIKKCNNFITYGEISPEFLGKLLSKKGIKASKEDIDSLMAGKKRAEELGIRLPLRLHPPRHGYEGIKKPFSNGGSLGYRGQKIEELIKRMM